VSLTLPPLAVLWLAPEAAGPGGDAGGGPATVPTAGR